MPRKGLMSIAIILTLVGAIVTASVFTGSFLSFLDNSENETSTLNETANNRTESVTCALDCTKKYPGKGADYQGCMSDCES